MENIDIDKILNRDKQKTYIQNILNDFNNNIYTNNKKGIYVYGNSGIGKTTFIKNILIEMNYDVILYNASDIRNKSVIESITKYNKTNKSIISLFHKNIKRPIIVMDEIDGMNSGDKGGINALIKIIRVKKTKKNNNDENIYNPIICISNYHIDKKIKELMKVCNTIEINKPTDDQVIDILTKIDNNIDKDIILNMVKYINGDLNKLKYIYKIYKDNKYIVKDILNKEILLSSNYDNNTKLITQKLINNKYNIKQHNDIINETDRTIIGLLWYENIIDILEKLKNKDKIELYLKILENICISDYIDRITFQRQIWIFNEMTCLIKVLKNNKLIHDNIKNIQFYPQEIRFTKILTKFSTEFNNLCFIQYLCQQLMMDKKDMISFFLYLKKTYNNIIDIFNLLDNYEITKLDINRIYRYLDKCIKDTTKVIEDDDEDIDEEDNNIEEENIE